MGTSIPIAVSEILKATEQTSLTYKIDFERGRIIGRVAGLEAVNQAIQKTLMTPRFKCLIYDNQYGSEIQDVVTTSDASPQLITAMMPRLIEDALSPDTRILLVYDFTCVFDGDEAFISFKADTIFGTTTYEGNYTDF